MGRLTNNLINRPNLINFVRQFCAPFQLMIRVHATWHVSSSLSLPSPSSCTLSSTIPSFRAFGPTNFSLMKIDFREFEGRVPVLTPLSNGQAFFPPVRIFDFFFFFFFVDFDTGTVKSSRIFILEMKLLTLNFIIEDNFFLERSFVVFPFYRCLYKIELFGRYFWG